MIYLISLNLKDRPLGPISSSQPLSKYFKEKLPFFKNTNLKGCLLKNGKKYIREKNQFAFDLNFKLKDKYNKKKNKIKNKTLKT